MKEENIKVIVWAADHATSLLSCLGERWLHVQGVVEQARFVGQIFDEEERAYLIAAAYVHDIGYAPSLKKINFHPLDGAYDLQSHGKQRLASLVAYHSEAQYEARQRGLTYELNQFSREQSAVADALIYCDMTTNSIGKPVTFEERIADIFSRYDETSVVNRAIHEAMPTLSLAVIRIEQRLQDSSLANKAQQYNTVSQMASH